jgi:uncharacterized surface protein with fasciclin (FAS1) repeats
MKKIIIPLLVCGLFACSKKDKEDTPTTPQLEAVTEVTAYLESVDSLSEFEVAFKKVKFTAADLADGVTIFAPGNESIGSYDLGARTMGKDLPDSIIKNHIVKGIFKTADLTDGKTLTTLSGKVLKVKVIDGVIYINGVKITFKDGAAGKQIIHTIAEILTGPRGSINIKVFDAMQWSVENRSGLPAADASVKLYTTQEKYFDGTPDYEATADANGIAHFVGIPVGDYYVVVIKGALSNIWPDVYKRTMKSTDSLYQTEAEIYTEGALYRAYATPGDFRFVDLNQDGRTAPDDVVDAPCRILSINDSTVTTEKILIGYEDNHNMKAFKTAEEALNRLPGIASLIGTMQTYLVMADGFMSDDAVCTGYPDWCNFDQFTITSRTNPLSDIWATMYFNIQQLNRIIYSLPTMSGDTTVLAAQARGLRAYAYLELATYFGELPINTDLMMSANIHRSTLEGTYGFIKNELLIALPDLPVSNSGSLLTVGGANALLARIAIVNNDFVAAKTYAGAVMQSGTYSLPADTGTVFENVDGPEIIWSIANSYPVGFYEYWGGRSFIPVTRLSEMYLIYAEAEVALGNLGSAREYINLISNRTGIGTPVINNQDEARTALVEASRYTFMREGHRFRNLVRWGLAEQVLSAKGYQQFRGRLPIPSGVLDNYPNIYQNIGYN